MQALLADPQWHIRTICDCRDSALEWARHQVPGVKTTHSEDDVFNDPEIDVVVLAALADTRKSQIEKAVEHGKHIIAEKPIAETSEKEWEIVELLEKHPEIFSTVNLYLRNSWYLYKLKEVIESGEIGDLAILRICHLTPGLAPGEGHESEGPAFHDCGMHYCDAARWLAGSEFKTMHSQALRMWSYKDPWFLQTHGTFENGVVFDITQGHVYGQLSDKQTHNSYMDIIGTKGIVRMTHDFKTAVVDIHGVTLTERIERPYGGKNIGTMCRLMAESLTSGKKNPSLPSMRDSAVASQFAWDCINDARSHDLPCIGTLDELDQIHRRRATMKDGYGLLHKKQPVH